MGTFLHWTTQKMGVSGSLDRQGCHFLREKTIWVLLVLAAEMSVCAMKREGGDRQGTRPAVRCDNFQTIVHAACGSGLGRSLSPERVGDG
jgi:hypothetical protein